MATRLDDTERAEALARLAGWSLVDGRDAIRRRYLFADFNEAFGFMTRAALVAEKLDHHPEWSNVYRTVEVTLTTHDAKGYEYFEIKNFAKFLRKSDNIIAIEGHNHAIGSGDFTLDPYLIMVKKPKPE